MLLFVLTVTHNTDAFHWHLCQLLLHLGRRRHTRPIRSLRSFHIGVAATWLCEHLARLLVSPKICHSILRADRVVVEVNALVQLQASAALEEWILGTTILLGISDLNIRKRVVLLTFCLLRQIFVLRLVIQNIVADCILFFQQTHGFHIHAGIFCTFV